MMVERNQKLLIFGEPFMIDSGVGGGGDDTLYISGENWSEDGEIPAASGAMAKDGGDAEALSPATDTNENSSSTKLLLKSIPLP